MRRAARGDSPGVLDKIADREAAPFRSPPHTSATRGRLLDGRRRGQVGLARVRAHRERVGAGRELLVGANHVHDGVDQCQMRERLREVAQVAAAARVDLLRVQVQR